MKKKTLIVLKYGYCKINAYFFMIQMSMFLHMQMLGIIKLLPLYLDRRTSFHSVIPFDTVTTNKFPTKTRINHLFLD